MANSHPDALYYPVSFFRASIRAVYYNHHLTTINNSLAHRLAMIQDNNDYQDAINEQKQLFKDFDNG